MTLSGDPGFYGILTDPVVGYVRLAAIMVEQGVRFIQLRIKDAPREQIVGLARSVRAVIPAECHFIINDDPHIAVEVGADGVHIGQDDLDYVTTRAIVGPQAIVGISTHNPDQTASACALGPDYIGCGPVYPTPSKKKPDPVIGLDGLRKMLATATVPAVAIGGIDHHNLKDVLAAGARSVCAVRCINQSKDPEAELDRMLQTLKSGYSNKK